VGLGVIVAGDKAREKDISGDIRPGANLSKAIRRAREVMNEPKAIWNRIKSEPATSGQLYVDYIAILAAIPLVSLFLGSIIFAGSPVIATFIGAIIRYALMLGILYISALIIKRFSKTFGGETDTVSSLKLIGYSFTPFYLGGVFFLVPVLGVLIFFFVAYAVYIYVQGVPAMTGVPAKRAGFFTVISLLTIFIVTVVSIPLFNILLAGIVVALVK